jgi:hypothetical protein
MQLLQNPKIFKCKEISSLKNISTKNVYPRQQHACHTNGPPMIPPRPLLGTHSPRPPPEIPHLFPATTPSL